MNIGVIHRRQGRTDEALRFYQDSRSLRDKLGLQQTGPYASLLANMGVAYNSTGDARTGPSACTARHRRSGTP